jgi:hypothetical protein
MSKLSLDLLDGIEVQTSASLEKESLIYSSTADKAYSRLMKMVNVTSYSQLQLLHSCPRKYQLSMHKAMSNSRTIEQTVNVDFTFGHAVGAGVQSYLLDADIVKASFNAFMAWRAPFTERVQKKKKSLWEAIIAIEKFAHWWSESGLADDWELAALPSGKPAIELAFSLHSPDGFKHYGHIDVVLKNKHNNSYAVLELKTTGIGADEAMYANSNQATGYSLMLETIWQGIPDYTVLYCVFSTSKGEWTLMPFDKTMTQRAEWIKDLMLDHSAISTYEELGFYPKRGESCYSFMRRCEFFGACNMVPDDELPRLEEDEEAEPVDATINLADVIASLKQAKERERSC